MKNSETEYDLKALTGKMRGDGGIPNAQLLADFAEAIVLRDGTEIARLRDQIVGNMGEAAMVDAAAVAAAFHGFVRVADSTGTPPEKAGGGKVTMEFREEVGINEFYAVQNT